VSCAKDTNVNASSAAISRNRRVAFAAHAGAALRDADPDMLNAVSIRLLTVLLLVARLKIRRSDRSSHKTPLAPAE
jgi:hypothetical protein